MMNEKEQIPARVGHASKDEGLSSGDDNAGKSTTAEAGAAGTAAARNGMTKDEYHLASLGYKQSFIRSLGILENWAATFTTMNFVSGMPQLFGFVMYTGGPQGALSNWTMVGGFSSLVALSMAEIAASLPTCGGIYFWSYKLGGPKYGPFLAWLTAWWNWVGWLTTIPGFAQGNTNFLISAIQIYNPNAQILSYGWLGWLISTATILMCVIPNIVSERVIQLMLRTTLASFAILMAFYWIWFPVSASGNFQSASILTTFENGINNGPTKQASDSYCWLVGVLFGAWVMIGYDASVHLAEETKSAQVVVARGMWLGTLATWLLSVPTLIMILFCLRDLDGIVNGAYHNNWAAYLVQLVGRRGAIVCLVFVWIDSCIGLAVCILSCQRITYAASRDGILPGSRWWAHVNPSNRLPVNAALLIAALSIALNAAVIGSEVAFGALTATATIATSVSYVIPIIARQTVGRQFFEPAAWNLGRFSPFVAGVASLYICFVFTVLLLPQEFPVTPQTLNYAPVMIGGVTIIILVGWFMPFGLGGRYWFKGPQRTITEAEFKEALIIDDDSSFNPS